MCGVHLRNDLIVGGVLGVISTQRLEEKNDFVFGVGGTPMLYHLEGGEYVAHPNILTLKDEGVLAPLTDLTYDCYGLVVEAQQLPVVEVASQDRFISIQC